MFITRYKFAKVLLARAFEILERTLPGLLRGLATLLACVPASLRPTCSLALQAKWSSIDFDYLGYAQLRGAEYRRRKGEFLADAARVFGNCVPKSSARSG